MPGVYLERDFSCLRRIVEVSVEIIKSARVEVIGMRSLDCGCSFSNFHFSGLFYDNQGGGIIPCVGWEVSSGAKKIRILLIFVHTRVALDLVYSRMPWRSLLKT